VRRNGRPIPNRLVKAYESNATCYKGVLATQDLTDQNCMYWMWLLSSGWYVIDDGCYTQCVYVQSSPVQVDFDDGANCTTGPPGPK